MPKKTPAPKRKPAHQMTGDEIARHVFPPKVHRHLKQLTEEQNRQEAEFRSQDKDIPS